MNTKLLRVGLLLLALTLLAVFAYREYAAQEERAHLLTGTVEATRIDVSTKVSGYIEELFLQEGMTVRAGDAAARIGRRDLDAAVLRDEAALAHAETSLQRTQSGNRAEEIRAAAERTNAARAAAEKADADYARGAELIAGGAISQQAFDGLREARDTANANLRAAQQEQALMESGSRPEDIRMAEEDVRRQQAILEIDTSAVSDLTVRVPKDGIVLSKNYERGEFVRAGTPIATLIDPQDVWVKVYVTTDVLGDLRITAHAGAGAYICGEETALLDSLEGRRGHPRLKPPFPAVQGLYARPTVINNVETIASLPGILVHGPEWYSSMGTERSKGHGIFSVTGHVARPGQFEAPFGITMRELIELAGGIRAGHELKFWVPGGSSTPIFGPEELDVPLDYESVGAAGSMLGTRALQVFDETVSAVRVVARWTEFYQHESCGKCTPCREGTYWMRQIMARLEAGRGLPGDVEKLEDIASNISGRSFCALGDASAVPVLSGIKRFRSEFEAGCTTPASQLFPYAASAIVESAR